ncbi:MAG: DegT/DnrJ/EryC1/StrS family aminotransferase [Spirulinaceae cyanobacterium RM2_2_10]|nr:DegT/DnrJ/EryC1/StrS family aminotransferase [bacterium]NJO19460.1 DegT/DnrJ/EryC1/StrS family aminotransferase [Spirulinaceae cyanobacterium RM2_2_10]
MTSERTIPFGQPWIEERDRAAVLEVLQGPILTHGPQCKAFEQEFAEFLGDGAYAVTVSSCTAALHLAYFHYGIGAGDEVIVPAQTHVATAHAVELVGATPVFVDCDQNGNIDCTQVAAAITPNTKAITLVHFLGMPCAMDQIVAIAERHDLKVIEDCAIALGTRYDSKHVGLLGDVGCFSFYPVKHITTAEGGMFVSRHADVVDSVRKLRAFGMDRSFAERTMPGIYDVVTLGFNYRMSDLQAALGRQQLLKLPEILARRRENFTQLQSLLSGLSDIRVLAAEEAGQMHSHYCLSIVLMGQLAAQRKTIVMQLREMGVGTSVYYPQPVPRMTYYQRKYGYEASRYPNATTISDASIALPVAPHVTLADTEYIAACLEQAIAKVKA